MTTDEIILYAIAAVVIIALIGVCMLLDLKLRRAESMEEQIEQDAQITQTYRWIKQILESDVLMSNVIEYDRKNGTQYMTALKEAFDVIDGMMENRGNNLVGYLMLAATTLPSVLNILRTVGLPLQQSKAPS